MARTGAMPHTKQRDESKSLAAHALRDLIVIVATGAAVALLLWRLSGPPRLWSPEWGHVRDVLTGSEVADADAITVAVTVAWLILGYLALVVGLRVVLTLLEHLTDGAGWVRTGMSLSNLITIPAVRRVVDGGVASVILFASWLPDPSQVASAAVIAPPASLEPIARTAQEQPAEPSPDEGASSRFVAYTVVRGDSLWEIARRLYGDGSRYVDIFEANRDRVMSDGERFADPRQIRTGWTLDIPLPAANVHAEQDAVAYRVARGDDLWSIAARFLGDGFRWTEIWERNRGREMGGGWRFTDPNLVHPGWMLELPLGASAASPSAEAPVRMEPTTPPSSAPPPTDTLPPDREETAAPEEEGAGGWDPAWPSVPPAVAFTAAGFALIGGAALFVHRMHRAGLLRIPDRRSPRAADSGDAGRVSLAARALRTALADCGFYDAHLLLVREAGDELRFTVRCAPGDADALALRRHDLERRLACQASVDVIGATRVEIALEGFRRLAASLVGELRGGPLLVVPVGAEADAIVYLNLAAVGSVEVVGEPGERRQLIRSWLATLATTHTADELVFRADDSTALLLGDLTEVPHFAGAAGDSDAHELALELESSVRTRSAEESPQRPVLAAIDTGEVVSGPLAAVTEQGSAVGLFLVASAAAEHRGIFSATVVLGASQIADETNAEPDGRMTDAVTLRLGHNEELTLERVLVRRDTSPRWREGAEISRLWHEVPEPVGGQSDPRGDEDEPDRSRLDETVAETADIDQHAAAHDFESVESGAVEQHDPSVTGAVERDLKGELAERGDGDCAEFREDTSLTATEMPQAAAATADSAERTVVPVELNGVERIPAALAVAEAESSSPAGRQHGLRQPSLFGAELDGLEHQGDEDTSALFTVRCLGGFEVEVAGTRIQRWSHQKAAEMLALLVAHGTATVPREQVSEALWPDFPWDDSVQHMLSNVASSLRSTLRAASGRPELRAVATARRGGYQLKSHLFRVDLDAFEAALREAATAPDDEALGAYDRAFALYKGDFLEGQALTWAEDYRREYRRRVLEALAMAADTAARLGESQRAVRYYELILAREPADESAARALMRLVAAAGDINGARKAYKALGEAIQRELDDPRAGPSPETRALLTELVGEARSA